MHRSNRLWHEDDDDDNDDDDGDDDDDDDSVTMMMTMMTLRYMGWGKVGGYMCVVYDR